MKDNQVALKIKYYVLGTGDNHFEGEGVLSKFKKEIHDEYFATFEIELADRGGGGNFVLELLMDITLKDYLMIIIGGVAWDLVKAGTKKLFIRPFIELYKKFRKDNSSQEIQELTFIFNDSRVKISAIKQITYEIDFEICGEIILSLAKHYHYFENSPGNFPLEIHIPLIEDSISNDTPLYRSLLSVDEPYVFNLKPQKKFTNEDYFKFWGLNYLGWIKYVYNLETTQLFENRWLAEDQFDVTDENNKYNKEDRNRYDE